MSLPSPAQIAEALGKRVMGQAAAVREMSVALAKKLAGLRTGNILLIGSSGSGKTTLMQAVEGLLAANPSLRSRSTVVRVHANVLGEEAELGQPGEKLLLRLLSEARQQLGPQTSIGRLVDQASHGLVFVDEVDKIRSQVGGKPNLSGIRAQEALLTLMENEAVPLRLPEWAGGETVAVDSSGLLFVCAGAFEGLYDAVHHRITAGRDKGALKPVTVVEGGQVREEFQFALRDWLRSEDLFEYGITPQFLSRFDAVVLLDSLKRTTDAERQLSANSSQQSATKNNGRRRAAPRSGIHSRAAAGGPGVRRKHPRLNDDLLRVFLGGADSGLRQSQSYFASQGIKFELTEAAARRIAREAARHPRLGARALKEVFRRVIGPYEFEPQAHAVNASLRIDEPEVERALAPLRAGQDQAVTSAGWDGAAPVPWEHIRED